MSAVRIRSGVVTRAYSFDPWEEIHNIQNLQSYLEKRSLWLTWYSASCGNPNNIQQQLHEMFLLDLSYRAIRSGIVGSPQNADIASRNVAYTLLMESGYVSTQALAIRRLLDKHNGAISLYRLLNDMKRHRTKLTREVFVSHDGRPYDCEKWPFYVDSTSAAIFGIESPSLGDFCISQHRHQLFDQLSGKAATSRDRNDIIRKATFSKLEAELFSVEGEETINLTHEILAHAAESIVKSGVSKKVISLEKLTKAHRAIVLVERALTDDLLCVGNARNEVPMPQLGLFKGLNQPFVPAQQNEGMYKAWDDLAKERDAWSMESRDRLYL